MYDVPCVTGRQASNCQNEGRTQVQALLNGHSRHRNACEWHSCTMHSTMCAHVSPVSCVHLMCICASQRRVPARPRLSAGRPWPLPRAVVGARPGSSHRGASASCAFVGPSPPKRICRLYCTLIPPLSAPAVQVRYYLPVGIARRNRTASA